MKRLAAFFSLMLLISCNKNYDYVGMFYSLGESADERFEMSMAYNDTHGYDKIHVDSDDYRLYVMTDVHVDFSTVNLDRYVSDYLNDSLAPPFSLCLGDVINATGHFDSSNTCSPSPMLAGRFITAPEITMSISNNGKNASLISRPQHIGSRW